MKVRRRHFMASTAALVASSSAFGASGSSASASGSYPSYTTNPIAPDTSGMTNHAMDIADHIRLGWNAGNTMEAIGGETAWGNPRITQKLIDKVKALGFDAVRLPCAWDQYANPGTGKISDT